MAQLYTVSTKYRRFQGIRRMCLVGRFIIEGDVDFSFMQQTLATLWSPGKGVCIKDMDFNLYLFQFYHEINIKRVTDGSP